MADPRDDQDEKLAGILFDRKRYGGAARRQSHSAQDSAYNAQGRGHEDNESKDGGIDKHRANLTAAQKNASTRRTAGRRAAPRST
eukprot:4315502-Pyramimonas_sp.AAC.1